MEGMRYRISVQFAVQDGPVEEEKTLSFCNY
jgi:hypothetical protein